MTGFPLDLTCKYHEPPFSVQNKTCNYIKLLPATAYGSIPSPNEGLIAWCLTADISDKNLVKLHVRKET